MKWFEGSIPAAIQDSRTRKVIFVVYVTGDDENSKSMDETWADSSIETKVEQNGMVVLKLDAKSDTCSQFSAIYPVVCIPCTYFIGVNGAPLEIVGGQQTPVDFLQKIDKAIKLHLEEIGEKPENPKEPPAPTESCDQSSGEDKSCDQGEPETKKAKSDPLQERLSRAKDLLAESTDAAADEASSSDVMSPAATVEDRVERAKEIIAQKREQMRKEELEAEKTKEKERLQVGKSMGRLRQNKEEIEAKEVKEQLRKDKEADRIARERVKEQIARDRAERTAKFNKEKEERQKDRDEKTQAAKEADRQAEAKAAAERSEIARIQFRLPDGSTRLQQFPATDSLDSARSYIQQEVGDRIGAFRLTTIYPKREFNEENMQETMRELQLAPSSVIVVLPGTGKAISKPASDGGDGFIMMLFSPLIALWNFIYNFLFGAPQPPAGGSTRSSPPRQENAASSSSSPSTSYGLRNRKEGNIHRLTNKDKDDDQATWNGNSTQQM